MGDAVRASCREVRLGPSRSAIPKREWARPPGRLAVSAADGHTGATSACSGKRQRRLGCHCRTAPNRSFCAIRNLTGRAPTRVPNRRSATPAAHRTTLHNGDRCRRHGSAERHFSARWTARPSGSVGADFRAPITRHQSRHGLGGSQAIDSQCRTATERGSLRVYAELNCHEHFPLRGSFLRSPRRLLTWTVRPARL